MAITWITPKTNWKKGETFEIDDFNRIFNNINYINYQLVEQIVLTSMGMPLTYSNPEAFIPWNYEWFNGIEINLFKINEAFENGRLNIGSTKMFYPNGAFITTSELNRIESATKLIKEEQEISKSNQRRLSFRLGTSINFN